MVDGLFTPLSAYSLGLNINGTVQWGRGVLSYAVLLLLDLKLSAVLERPLDDVGVVASALHPLAGLQSRPPVGEVLD